MSLIGQPSPILPNEYHCAHCGGVFTKGWSDEEAEAEYATTFSTDPHFHEPREVVCDDCYKEFTEWSQGVPHD